MGISSLISGAVDPLIDEVLGDDVVYARPGQQPITVRGFLNREFSEGLGINSNELAFECASSAIHSPAKGDVIIDGHTAYRVADIRFNEPDPGRLTLLLERQ